MSENIQQLEQQLQLKLDSFDEAKKEKALQHIVSYLSDVNTEADSIHLTYISFKEAFKEMVRTPWLWILFVCALFLPIVLYVLFIFVSLWVETSS